MKLTLTSQVLPEVPDMPAAPTIRALSATAVQILWIVGIAAALLFLIRRVFGRITRRQDKIHLKFVKSILNFLVILVAVYSILSLFEFTRQISTTLVQSSALIVAVATFAAQQTLGNLISGFSISASKPLEIGQKVKIVQGGSVVAEGIVRDMTIRHVAIEQFDTQICLVPNSVIDSSIIVNTNYTGNVGSFIEIEVAYDTNVDEARDIICRIIDEEPLLIHNRRTSVLVNRFTANGMVLKFALYAENLDNSFQASSNVRQRVVADFLSAGIVIPYQTVTLDGIAEAKTGEEEKDFGER